MLPVSCPTLPYLDGYKKDQEWDYGGIESVIENECEVRPMLGSPWPEPYLYKTYMAEGRKAAASIHLSIHTTLALLLCIFPTATESSGLNRTEKPSMALIPSSMTSTSLSTTPGSGAIAPLSAVHHAMPMHTALPEAEEPWTYVTKSLMLAVMGSQPPATAASTLLSVFRPLVDGWGTARRDSKRWKERAEAYLADHHNHKAELAHKHDALQAQVQAHERSLAESEAKVRELESHHATLRSSASSLEKKLAEAEAAALAAKQTRAREGEERRKEADAMAKSAQDAKAAFDRLRRETDSTIQAQNAEINKLQDKIKEDDTAKAKSKEQLYVVIEKNASLEEQLSRKSLEISTLQTRVTELNTRKEALERQLTFYQRLPTRRY